MSSIKFNELNDDQMNALADLFKVLGDCTRVRILASLTEKESVCVSEIAEILGMTTSAVSHQLKILKQNKLVKSRREGKLINYSLADEHISMIVETAIEHTVE